MGKIIQISFGIFVTVGALSIIFITDSRVFAADATTPTMTLTEFTVPIILPYTSRTITYPELVVTRTKEIPSTIGIDGVYMVPFDGSVDYYITVKNIGGDAYNVTIYDQLWPQKEDKLTGEKSWYVDQILYNQEITFHYTQKFDDTMAPGIYVNYAWAEGLSGDTYQPNEADPVGSNVASTGINIAPRPVVFEPVLEDVKLDE